MGFSRLAVGGVVRFPDQQCHFLVPTSLLSRPALASAPGRTCINRFPVSAAQPICSRYDLIWLGRSPAILHLQRPCDHSILQQPSDAGSSRTLIRREPASGRMPGEGEGLTFEQLDYHVQPGSTFCLLFSCSRSWNDCYKWRAMLGRSHTFAAWVTFEQQTRKRTCKTLDHHRYLQCCRRS